jgi:hypothetical protein
MRGARSLIFLVLVAAGLGAYLYFVEMKREPGDAAEKKDKVFSVEADKIDELTIKSESGERTTLKKNGKDWQVVAPAGSGPAAVDQTEVSGITTNIATLEQQRVVEEKVEKAEDLKEFGLAEPRIEVAFKSGGAEQKLQIGSKTPTGGDLYAKIDGQSKVFLISSFLESTFNRGTFDLRDKTALKIDAEKIDAVEVTTKDGTLRFGKTNSEWRLASPPENRADSAMIGSLVSRLGSLQMKSMAPAGELKTYGLDAPTATVRVGSGSSQATLLIGKAGEQGTVYAKDASRPDVFTIESSIADELKKGAGEYRLKDIFDARAFNTTRVEIARGADTLVFEKAGDKWKQVAPSAKDVDTSKVEALLSAATGARATSFVDMQLRARPELTLALKFDGDKEERVSFYKGAADALAGREGTPGLAKIESTVIDDIVKAFEALK